MAIVALGALMVLVVGIGSWVMSSFEATSRDVAWLAGTTGSAAPEAEVYARYLTRHRRHRVTGGLFGALFAIIVGIRWYGTVTIGIGQGSPLADILFCTLTGVLVGALSAETFRLNEPPSTTILASLTEREPLARPELVRVARAVSVGAVAVAALIAVTGHGRSALAIAVSSLLVVALAELTRSAIASRRRPILSEGAQGVDVRIRSFAATSVARLQLAAAVLTAGWVLAKAPDATNTAVGLLHVVAVLGCLVLTVVLLLRAAPRPPRTWMPAST